MSFNPNTGLVYVPTTRGGSRTFAVDPGFDFGPNQMNTGVPRRGRGDPSLTANPRVPDSIGPVAEGNALLAWDPIAQQERWSVLGGGGSGGGTFTTAGNLVFQVINDGRFLAYTADTGEKLLEIDPGLPGGMAPPITYMLDGIQYVSLMGGTGTGGEEPVLPKLLTFALDGEDALPQ